MDSIVESTKKRKSRAGSLPSSKSGHKHKHHHHKHHREIKADVARSESSMSDDGKDEDEIKTVEK